MKLATWLVDSRTFARRHRIGISVAVLLLIAYALAGFFWVPRIARSEITDYVTQTLHRKVSIADLTFNPFTFVAHVRGFALTEEDGSPLVRFDHLLVNAELSSLPRRALVLKEVRLDAPDVRVIVGTDGTVNLARLALPPSAPPADAKPSEPPRVRISRLAVVGGQISVRDESRPQPVSLALSPIEFALADFSTERNYQNAYRFSGSTLAGERFEWTGEFTVQPLGSVGQFRVQDVKAATLDAYLADALPPKLASGLLSLNGNYRFTLLPFTLNLTLPAISVRDLKLAARGNEEETPITLPALDVTDTIFSYEKRTLRVQKIALQQPHVDFVRASPTATNLATLFGAQESGKPAAAESHLPTVTQSDTPAEPAAASPWKVNIDAVQLTEGSIAAEDRTTQPAAKFSFAPLNVTVNDLSSDAAVPAKIAADVRINDRGKVSVTSSITRTPLGGDYTVEVSDVPLPALEPYVEQRTAANLSSGDFAAKGSGSFTSVEGKPLQLKFAGGLAVKNLKTTDRIANDRFVEWNEIAVDGIDFGLAPDKLRIEKITARKPYARVVIERNRSLNVMNVLRLGDGAPPPAEDQATDEESESPPPPPKDPPPPPKNAEKPFPAEIRTIEIIDGTARFADNSVDPSFHAGILQLRGGIQGLSSNPASRAKVQLQGSVDRYAPVDIKGEVNVLSAAKYTDVSMNFRNMELTLFNPYSGKFAGYNITKGKLSTELHYKVDDRKLDADHHIIVDNLEFGAKTDSKDAAPVPVKLCVALLKDRNGVIDVNLPVSGSLDDPHFRLGPIVWKAVLGLLKKIATAPFAALGSLFGGGPELAYVDFPLGTADLSPPELDKIQKLSKALGSRPQLKLNLPATVVGDEDRKALAEAALHAQVAPPTAQTPQEAKRYLDALERLYKATKKAAVQYPESAAKDAELVDEHIHFVEPQLLELLAPDDAAASRLGRQRARAVQDQLLTNSEINPERVFVTTEPVEKANIDGHARMQMKLE